jgi:hypothetical protein
VKREEGKKKEGLAGYEDYGVIQANCNTKTGDCFAKEWGETYFVVWGVSFR